MANDSSFTGDVLFFNKTLKNTPENRIKMQGLLTAYLDISNNYSRIKYRFRPHSYVNFM